MAVAINPIFPTISAQGVTPGAVLQPGTVIDATVLKVLDANLVRIAIASLSIDVQSEVALKAGQTLQLAVSQTEQGIKLAIVPQPGDGDVAPSSSAALPLSSQSSSSASVAAPALDESPSTPQPATSVAPNIAAAKIAPQIDAPIDPRAARPLTNVETIAVAVAAQSAAAKQASLSPLFANLNVAATLQSLPPALQEAAARLLSVRPQLDTNLSGDDVKTAFEKSGLFLEQSLAAKASPSSDAPDAQPAILQNFAGENDTPDLKAALIVFRQTVASWLGDAAETSPVQTPSTPAGNSVPQPQAGSIETPEAPFPNSPQATNAAPQQQAQPQTTQTGQSASPPLVPGQTPAVEYDEVLLPQASIHIGDEQSAIDPKIRIYAPSESLPAATARATAAGTGLTSLQEVLQAFPKGVRDAVAALFANEANAPHALNSSASKAAASFESTDVPPPPFRGAAPSAQPVASPSIANDAEPAAVARHLVDDADAAIARQTLLQVASLPDRVDAQAMRPDATAPRWNFEIPFATPQGTAVAQFEISRDGGGISADPSRKIWKARFSLNVEPTGPVHAQVTLSGDRASVRMWAERPQTAAQLRANAPQLTHALREAALEPGDIVIGDGAPPQPAKAVAGHFLDRAS
ncbi:MAG: flagellar hook-length control protein FliK [Rhizobiales bacterium]|nr:flagellar hook-length control protein FliK [Hyphomicrobiales bacterium]